MKIPLLKIGKSTTKITIINTINNKTLQKVFRNLGKLLKYMILRSYPLSPNKIAEWGQEKR